MTLLNRAECSALRGIAIIGIFLHNYLHWLGPMVKENEYQFHQHNAERFWYILTHPDENLIYHLFSFFGHYGVPVFVFLSGYGLYLKYESGATEQRNDGVTESWIGGVWSFMKSHYNKLFPMMFLGFVAFAMVDWLTPGRHHWTWDAIIEQLTMTINLFPDPDHRIWPGPYWFFGLMMELYLVYRLLLYRRHWGWNVGLIICCMAIQALCWNDPEGDAINRIRYNFMGNMLPFGMGLLVARVQGVQEVQEVQKVQGVQKVQEVQGVQEAQGVQKVQGVQEKTLNFKLSARPEGALAIARTLNFIIAVAAIISLSFNFWTWLIIPLFVVIAHIGFIKMLSSMPAGEILVKGLAWVGGISAAIFVCHPITRKIFIPISRSGDILDGLVIYIIATIMLAMIFKKMLEARGKR